MFIVGDKEAENGTVSVRSRKEGEMQGVAVDDIIAKLDEEVKTKAF